MTRILTSSDGAEKHKELLSLAQQGLKNSYSPYSHFAVSCALLADDGTVFTGVNVENINFTGSICAERSAFVKAISEGYKRFDTIAIVASKAKDCWPCGQCRQFMHEFGDHLLVVVEAEDGIVRSRTLAELIPFSVEPKPLD